MSFPPALADELQSAGAPAGPGAALLEVDRDGVVRACHGAAAVAVGGPATGRRFAHLFPELLGPPADAPQYLGSYDRGGTTWRALSHPAAAGHRIELLPAPDRVSVPSDGAAPRAGPWAPADDVRILRSIVGEARDSILVTEAEPIDGVGPRIVFANPAFLRLTGYAAEEVLGRTPRMLQGPKTDRAALDRIRAALRAWTPVREEVLNYRKDGTEFWAELDIAPVADATGWFTHWVSVQRDITDRKRLEAERAEHAAAFRSLADQIPDCVFVLDPDDPAMGVRILFANGAVRRTHGYAPEELIGRPLATVLAPGPATDEVADRTARLLAGEDLQFEIGHLRKDGRAFPVEVRSARIAWQGRRALLGVVRDISDRTRVEDAVRRERAFLRRVVDAVPGMVCVKDAAGRFRLVNQTVAEANNRPAEQIVGLTDFDLSPIPDQVERFRADEAALLASGAAKFVTDEAITFADGTTRWFTTVKVPLPDPDGGPPQVLAVSTDITDRRRAETAVRESEERYRLLFDANPQAMWVYDRATLRFLAANDAAAARYGYARDEFLGMTLEDIRPPEDRAALRTAVAASGPAPSTGGVWRHRTKDGRLLHVRIDSYSIAFAGRDARLVLSTDITDRVRAEETLRASEENYARLVDSLDVVIWEADPATFRFLLVSKRAESLLGYPVAAWLTDPTFWQDHIHADDRDGAVAYCTAETAAGRDHEFEYRMVAADGRTVWIRDRAQIVAPPGGPRRLVGLMQDITDRKRAEDELRAGEERLRLALAAGRMGTFDWDIAADRTVWSASHYELFGYDPGDPAAPHRRFMDRVHPEELPGLRAHIADVMARGGKYRYDYRVRLPDGTVRWMASLGEFYRDAAGRPVRMVGVDQDVSARKEAEADRARADELYRLLADNIGDVISILDPARRVLFTSPSITRVAGYRPEDLAGRDSDAIIHPDDLAVIRANRALVDAGGESVSEWRARRADGTYFWVETLAKPVLNPDGTLRAVICCTRDITARKALEEQLRRTQKLEAIGQLAGGVAHDFNNLLTVVNGNAEILLELLPDGHDARTLAAAILRAGDRGAGLTRQLLAFSRQQVLKVEVFDPAAVVADMLRMVGRLLGEHIAVETAIDPAAGAVRGDAGQFEQVVMNLAVNARDAMPGGGRLAVRLDRLDVPADGPAPAPEARPGAYVRLTVADTGTGMAPDVVARLFEPFFTTKPAGKGTGLGLATVYGIVRQSRGFLTVESALGRGSVFAAHFPRHDPAGPGEKPPNPPAAPVGTETVLVVEDDAEVRAFTAEVLRRSGYAVVPADGAAAALQACDALPRPPDLVLTDVIMPGGGGRELAAALTARYPGIKVAFVSGYTDDAALRTDIADRTVAFLPKPFSAADLTRFLRHVLDG